MSLVVTEWTLSALSEALRTKQVSPVEITRACLDRIGEHDRQINAFITTIEKPALKSARVAESEIVRGRYRGPLHGVPYAIKDLFLTAAFARPAAPGSCRISCRPSTPQSSNGSPTLEPSCSAS